MKLMSGKLFTRILKFIIISRKWIKNPSSMLKQILCFIIFSHIYLMIFLNSLFPFSSSGALLQLWNCHFEGGRTINIFIFPKWCRKSNCIVTTLISSPQRHKSIYYFFLLSFYAHWTIIQRCINGLSFFIFIPHSFTPWRWLCCRVCVGGSPAKLPCFPWWNDLNPCNTHCLVFCDYILGCISFMSLLKKEQAIEFSWEI